MLYPLYAAWHSIRASCAKKHARGRQMAEVPLGAGGSRAISSGTAIRIHQEKSSATVQLMNAAVSASVLLGGGVLVVAAWQALLHCLCEILGDRRFGRAVRKGRNLAAESLGSAGADSMCEHAAAGIWRAFAERGRR